MHLMLMLLKLTKWGYSMSRYYPYDVIGRYGRYGANNIVTYGMVKAFWFADDYRSLLMFLDGKFVYKPDTHFISSMIAEFYDLDFTTPYEVSMWLKQQIREGA